MTPEEQKKRIEQDSEHIAELEREILGYRKEADDWRKECLELKAENARLRQLLKPLCEIIVQELG